MFNLPVNRQFIIEYLIKLSLLFSIIISSKYTQGQEGSVGINTSDPKATLDVNGNIRIRANGGAGKVLVSDSSGIASWKYLDLSGADIVCVTDFGANGNDENDDTEAFLAAIDSVSRSGAVLCVPQGFYQISSTLRLPDGVILAGQGRGSTPLTSPTTGTILNYSGEGWALIIEGHHAGVSNLVIKQETGWSAAGGLQVLADNRLVESIFLHRLHIFGFVGGTALELKAQNSGGIAYAHFQEVRVRHGQIGISLHEESGSFINSNSFTKCLVTGGGFKYGTLIQGGNNNVFYGAIIEFYESELAHLAVLRGQITMHELRIEARDQPDNIPLLYLAEGTSQSWIQGLFSGGLILNNGSNHLQLVSSKSMEIDPTGTNRFLNAGFHGMNNNRVPGWELSGSGIRIEVQTAEIIPYHQVLKFTVPPGSIGTFSPSFIAAPKRMETGLYDFCSFAAYTKTKVAGSIRAIFNDSSGVSRSIGHLGDGRWQKIGLRARTERKSPPFPRFQFINTGGIDTLVCYLTTPSFTFGDQLPELYASPITEAGGQVYGLLSTNVIDYEIPGSHWLSLPHSANVFILQGTTDIHRINVDAAIRFPRGSVITLLFEEEGVKLQQLGYLILKEVFISSPNSSITLLSLGDGRWRELNRNL